MQVNLKQLLCLAAAPIVPAVAHASGFQIVEQSPSGIGTAFAGAAAIAQDASTIYSNPAGLIRLQQPDLVTGVNYLDVKAEFKDTGSLTVQSQDPLTVVPTGGESDDGGETAWVPNFYYSHPVNDRMVVGFGIFAPYGLVTDYNDDWVGRYVAIKSDLATLNFNPSIAYRINEQLTVGFGVSLQYLDVELTNAIDLARNGTSTYDGKAKVQGDDIGYGVNVGLLYEPTDTTRIGLAYRSAIKSDISGDAHFTLPQGFEAYESVFHTQDVSAELTFPETLSLSIVQNVGQSLSLMGDISWTRWNRFGQLDINFEDPATEAAAGTSIAENWENTFRYSVGASYRLNNAWLLRAGVSYDETPIPSDELRSPRIPDNDRLWLACGARWSLTDALDVDIGYVHIIVDDSRMDNSVHSAGHIIRGTVDGAVDIISVAGHYRF